jgi:hypothetical protein
MEAKREFDQVSRLIKSEVSRFEKERIDDFKKSLENLLTGMIARQREVLTLRDTWKLNIDLTFFRSYSHGNITRNYFFEKLLHPNPHLSKMKSHLKLTTVSRSQTLIHLHHENCILP